MLGGTWIFSGDPGHTVADVGFIGDLAAMLWVAIASVFLIRGAADRERASTSNDGCVHTDRRVPTAASSDRLATGSHV